MTFIGDNGALSLINFYEASAITALGSLIFYYWGIKSAKIWNKIKRKMLPREISREEFFF